MSSYTYILEDAPSIESYKSKMEQIFPLSKDSSLTFGSPSWVIRKRSLGIHEEKNLGLGWETTLLIKPNDIVLQTFHLPENIHYDIVESLHPIRWYNRSREKR